MDLIFADNILFSLAKTLLITFCTLAMMFSLTEFKYGRRKIFLIFLSYLLWVFFSTAMLLLIGGFSLLLKVFLVTVSLPALFITYFVAKDSPTQAVFLYVTQIATSLILTMTVTIFNATLKGNECSDLIFRALAYAIVIYFEWRYLRRPFRRLAIVIQRGWTLLSLIPVSFCLLIVLVGLYPKHFITHKPSIIYIYAISLTMVIVYIVLFQSLLYLYQIKILTHDKELLSLQVSALADLTKTVYETENNFKIQRHDMRHRLHTISELILSGEYGSALEYIGTADSRLMEAKPFQYCNNPILDAILSFYFRQTEQLQIHTLVKLDIPQQLSVDAAELSIVFANALENAVRACQSLPAANRQIVCRCVSSPRMVLEISNTYEGEVLFDKDGLPITQEIGHGVGTRSIAAFVKKYDAVCIYTAVDGWFTIRIAL